MNPSRLLVLLPLSVVPLATPREAPSFAPEEGSSVTKTFVDATDFDLDDLSLTASGQDMTAMIGEITLTISNEKTVTVTDVYDSVGDGRPLKLTRTYDELDATGSVTGSAGGQSQDQDMGSSSELEGLSVVFTWDPDAEEYDVAFADEGGDDDLLDGLEENMDLRFLLPPDEVEEGDTWEVPLEDLVPLTSTGGNLRFAQEDVEEMPEGLEELFGDGLSQELIDSFEGSCTCTFLGVVDGDDGPLAEIQVEIEASSYYDFSELLSDVLDALPDDFQMGEISVDVADLALDLTATGTLLWDMGASRMNSFEALGDGELAVDLSLFVEAQGQEASLEAAAEFSGSFSKSVSVEE